MTSLLSILTAQMRVLLVGPPGIGKTARIAAAARAMNRRLIVMRASLSERVDFGGCLVPDQAAGVTRALPLELLRDLRSTPEPTLLFLDDLGQAPIDVQAALMRLFDAGELSPQVLICGATNRPGDKAGVSCLCEPLRSRFDCAFAIPTPADTAPRTDGVVTLGTWSDELEGWCQWAADAGAPAEVIAWHRSTSGLGLGLEKGMAGALYAWRTHADPAQRFPDFRSWHTVCRLWDAGLRDLHTIGSTIGLGPAQPFLAFARLADGLPTPQQIWMDPLGANVPADPGQLYLVASMLAQAAEHKFAGPFCKYIDRLPQIFGALAARDVYRRLGAKLSANPDWQKWWVKNQDLFVS